jgi:MFS family permease
MLVKKPLHVIYIALFIYFLQNAFTIFVNSSFLSNGCNCNIPTDLIGIIFTAGSVLALVLLSELPGLASRYGNRTMLIGLLIINLASILGIMIIKNPYLMSVVMALYLSVNAAILMSFDVFLEEYTSKEQTGDARGIFTTVTHIALVIAMIIVGFVLEKPHGYMHIYAISADFAILALVFLLVHHKTFIHTKAVIREPFLKNVLAFWKHTELRKVFLSSFVLQFFFATMAIYSPLYLNQHLGIGWDKIGLIIAIMMLPFVFFFYPPRNTRR